MDFPRAWEIARSIPVAEHAKHCSYFRTDGGLLCDCDVLTTHPEYDVIERASAVVVEHEEGRFAQEQEAIAAEAAHMAEVAMEEPSAEVVVHGTPDLALLERDQGIDPPIDPLDIPDEYDLPLHGSILACPKCGHNTVRVEWHVRGVLSEPCGRRFGWPNIQNLSEHLCRTCVRCQYGWPEQVFSGA